MVSWGLRVCAMTGAPGAAGAHRGRREAEVGRGTWAFFLGGGGQVLLFRV